MSAPYTSEYSMSYCNSFSKFTVTQLFDLFNIDFVCNLDDFQFRRFKYHFDSITCELFKLEIVLVLGWLDDKT